MAVAYADEHGLAAAAQEFGFKANTIKGWRSHQKHGGRDVPKVVAPVVPPITSLDQATSATLYEAKCHRCDRRYVITLGDLAAIFAARQQPTCERCRARVAHCVTIPRPEWEDGMVAYAQLDANRERGEQ